MSRHRNVRSMNYHDEYDGYDDVYGHSVEDDYCVSPATAAEFMFDRTQHQALSSFMGSNEGIPEEDEEEEDSQTDSLQDSANYKRPNLNDIDEGRLNSCLEELRNILGESTPEHVMVDAVIKHNFEYERALDALLTHQDTPKEQRQQRANRRNKDKTLWESNNIPKLGGLEKSSSPAKVIKSKGISLSNLAQQQQSKSKDSESKNTPPHVKQSSFSLANLAKEQTSSPPGKKSNFPLSLQSFKPMESKTSNTKPPKIGMSLSQLASSHSSSSNTAVKNSDAKKPPTTISLSALAKSHTQESKSLKDVIGIQAEKSKSDDSFKTKPTPSFSLAALAKQEPKATKVSLASPASEHNQKSESKKILPPTEKDPPSKGSAKNLQQVTSVKKKPAINLSDLIKEPSVTDQSNEQQKKKQMNEKKIQDQHAATLDIKSTLSRPSLFAAAVCSGSKNTISPPMKNSSQLNYPNFAYQKQVCCSVQKENTVSEIAIPPFDFSTASPDDIVQGKQKAAFVRPGEATATNDPSFPVQGIAQPGFTLGDPPSKPVASDSKETGEKVTNINLPQSVAKMTFSSGSTAKSGFTPEKVDISAEANKEEVEHVKKKINLGNDRNSGTINGSVSGGATVELPTTEPSKLRQETGASGDVGLTPSKSFSKSRYADLQSELEKRKMAGKDYINLVVIGHVDAGKSTLMGHALYQLGCVNKKTMHRYEQDAKKMGKASFAYAWVLDETEEERTRGVTMDVAQTRFETDTKMVTLLDAPGHKDFIPNMITGAAQADVAVLVVNSTRGEFETGFESGGQTREHAMLIRSLGVSQLVVAINKMDTVDWSQERYNEIVKKLGTFLKQAGFKETDVTFIPCSGLSGENLVKQPTDEKLASWYKGPTIIQGIDTLKAPERDINKPLRMCVSDVFKGMGAGFCVSGTLQAGSIQAGDKVLVMPQGEIASCKGVAIDNCPVPVGFAGDNVTVTITGIDMTSIAVGSILCDPSNPIKSSSRIQARVVIFNIDVPLTKGFPVVFHYQALSEPAHITKLVSQLHKSSGEIVRRKPRCLTKNSNAVIEIVIDRPVCIELYKDFKDLGRFMLRYGGHTIAAGLVTEIKHLKAARGE